MKGFKVQAYSSTKEALDEICDDPRKFRLVISDVMMKQMNGAILAMHQWTYPIVATTNLFKSP